MGHRHPRGAAARTIAVAFAALALAGGCAARGAPNAGQVAASESVPTDDVTTQTPVPTVDQSTEQTTEQTTGQTTRQTTGTGTQGQSESDPAPDRQPSPDPGGDGGGSGGGSGNRAAGSPIDVPTVPDAHIQMEGLKDTIRDLFIRACGGTKLCVTLKYQDGACFVGYAPSGHAARGSVVTVLTESQDECDKPHNRGTDGGGSTDGSTNGSTDSGSGGTTDPPTGTAPVPTGTGTGSEQTDGTGTG